MLWGAPHGQFELEALVLSGEGRVSPKRVSEPSVFVDLRRPRRRDVEVVGALPVPDLKEVEGDRETMKVF